MVKSNSRNSIDDIYKSLLLASILFFFVLLEILPLADYCAADNVCIRNRPGTTKKICQLTGEYDKEGWNGWEPLDLNYLTLNRTQSRYGVVGTDLGASFAHRVGDENRTYFLFGDTITADSSIESLDRLAYTTDTNYADCLDLTFNNSPPSVHPPINQNICSIPTEGISYNGKMYVYFIESDEHHNMCGDGLAKSYLAVSSDGGYTFDQKYLMSTYNNAVPGKFINVQVEVVETYDDIDYNGIRSMLPLEIRNHPVLFVWGSGKFRASNPFLAYMSLSNPLSIEDKSTIQYYSRLDESGLPIWSSDELDAGPLFDDPVVGELSVSWNLYLKKWLMFYGGVSYRVADYPWGPWSPSRLLFNPGDGYCHFMHRGDCTEQPLPNGCSYEEFCDYNVDFHQRDSCENVECRWGGAYGPYIISSNGIQDQESTIYYTLSTWNPYQVMLMESTLDIFLDQTPPTIISEPAKYKTALPGITLSTNPAAPTIVSGRDFVVWQNTDDGCGVGSVTWQHRVYASGENWVSHDMTYKEQWYEFSFCYPGMVLIAGEYEFRILIGDVAENISTSKTYYIRTVSMSDIDSDGILDYEDNCPNHYNPDQSDSYPPLGNGIGDACDCEGNFNSYQDGSLDGLDCMVFKLNFGRNKINRPCTAGYPCDGDFNCDGNVDGYDSAILKKDFGRNNLVNPCPYNVSTPWCVYQ